MTSKSNASTARQRSPCFGRSETVQRATLSALAAAAASANAAAEPDAGRSWKCSYCLINIRLTMITAASIATVSNGRDVYRLTVGDRLSLSFIWCLLMRFRHNEARLAKLYTDRDILLLRSKTSATKLATPAPARYRPTPPSPLLVASDCATNGVNPPPIIPPTLNAIDTPV